MCIRDRYNREGIGNTILAVIIGKLCHRRHGGDAAVLIPAVHRIGSGSERLAPLAAVRRGTGFLAVYHVGGDGQNGEGGLAVPVGGAFRDLVHEHFNHLHGDFIRSGDVYKRQVFRAQ